MLQVPLDRGSGSLFSKPHGNHLRTYSNFQKDEE